MTTKLEDEMLNPNPQLSKHLELRKAFLDFSIGMLKVYPGHTESLAAILVDNLRRSSEGFSRADVLSNRFLQNRISNNAIKLSMAMYPGMSKEIWLKILTYAEFSPNFRFLFSGIWLFEPIN
jgi:hypothetical protein